ncbi:hypothetical protein BDL97_01G029900 [Sphagnum fallax]|nr:hypothetical protein BDL97_01G029900 [Sphagnum fallax]
MHASQERPATNFGVAQLLIARFSIESVYSRFNGKRVAPSSSASSSVILAAISNIHAHGLQTIHDTPMADSTSHSRLGIGHTQIDHNMKEVQERQQIALDFVVPDFIPPACSL